MENLLAVMMRLRNARNLDSRQTNAIDNAYFACRPPDKAASRRRKRSTMQVGGGGASLVRVGEGSSCQGVLPCLGCCLPSSWGVGET